MNKTDQVREEKETDIIEGELVGELPAAAPPVAAAADSESALRRLPLDVGKKAVKTKARKIYLLLPALFLTVTLLGGLRLTAPAGDFLFLKPALVCLIFAAILLLLFSRAKLLNVGKWFSEDAPTLDNVANAAVLTTLFAASVQIFNSLLPERGLPLWIIGFCFFWTLWNNLFADFEVKKLLRSLGAMFGLAFVVKYLVLANLSAPQDQSWWESITQNPTQSAASWLLDLPAFAAATGYVQFFALALYLLGLYLLPSEVLQKRDSSDLSSEIIS